MLTLKHRRKRQIVNPRVCVISPRTDRGGQRPTGIHPTRVRVRVNNRSGECVLITGAASDVYCELGTFLKANARKR